jgi:type VI secretion system secreted protein VgrG
MESSRRPVLTAIALAIAVGWVTLMGAEKADAAGVPGDPAFLGTASGYAVLAAAAVTNTGFSVLTGDLGLSPNGPTSITGFPPGLYSGALHAADAAALQARSDLTADYGVAAGLTPTLVVGTADLDGSVFTAGVYNSGSSLLLSVGGTITLSGGVDDVFVFQAGSTLTTGSGSTVQLTGGAQACNVYWQVGSSATLGTNSTFAGTIMAHTSISATTGAAVQGRLLAGAIALSGAVTLQGNAVNSASPCLTGGIGGGGPTVITPGGGGGTGGGGAGGSATESLAATGWDRTDHSALAALTISAGLALILMMRRSADADAARAASHERSS